MNCNVIWTLHHINVFKPTIQSFKPLQCNLIYNAILQASINAILQASINAISVIKMSLLHHKSVYSNPQYNPASLCIKELLNLLPADESGNP